MSVRAGVLLALVAFLAPANAQPPDEYVEQQRRANQSLKKTSALLTNATHQASDALGSSNRVQTNATAIGIPDASPRIVSHFRFPVTRIGLHYAGLDDAKVLPKIKSLVDSPDQKIDKESNVSPTFRDAFQTVSRAADARIVIAERQPKELDEFSNLPQDGPLHVVLTSGDGFPLSDPVPVDDPKVDERVAEQLAKWAKWFNLFDLVNNDPTQLKIELQLKVVGDPRTKPTNAERVVVRTGQELEIKLLNRSSRPLFFTILDLSTDGSISVLYPPPGENESLEPNTSWAGTVAPFVPEGRRRVRDFVKVIATVQPSDFRFLHQQGIKGLPKDAKTNPLVQLVGEAYLVEKGRGKVQSKLPEWITVTRAAEVER